MKIDQDVKDFLSKNKNLINKSDFTSLYELASKERFYGESISQMTYLFYEIGIDPLQYMNFIPETFALNLNLPITTINIPDNIESIYPRAFEHTNAVKVIAPANLKTAPLFAISWAFADCDDLIEADFSKCHSYEEIDKYLFANCSKLKIIKFPENLYSIRLGAFQRCKSLTSIDLSNYHKLTSIGPFAFSQCENLTSIYLPNSIEEIKSRAFDTGKPITIKFDGTQQEWEDKFGTENNWRTWTKAKIDIQYLR